MVRGSQNAGFSQFRLRNKVTLYTGQNLFFGLELQKSRILAAIICVKGIHATQAKKFCHILLWILLNLTMENVTYLDTFSQVSASVCDDATLCPPSLISLFVLRVLMRRILHNSTSSDPLSHLAPSSPESREILINVQKERLLAPPRVCHLISSFFSVFCRPWCSITMLRKSNWGLENFPICFTLNMYSDWL